MSSNSNALSNASNDANQNMSSSPAGSPTSSCGDSPARADSPSNQTLSPETKSWIAIKLVDQHNKPVAGQQYQVKLPDGSLVEGDLDKRGTARINGIDPGNCQVTFPDVS